MNLQDLRKLMSKMSLEEKADQLLQVSGIFFEKEGVLTGPENVSGYTEKEIEKAGSILGTVGAAKLKKIQEEYIKKQPHHIPLLFMADIINGYRTIFPIPLAQGCSFDTELAKEAADIAAKESAAAGIHVTFSPMVDLVRDARWGRVMESTGEDAYLNSCFARAMVEGYQGKKELSQKGKIAACIKHFAAYGAPVAGREYNSVELSERTLRDDYFPAYEEGIKAGAEMVMTSFNTLNRIPSSANKWLLRDILRGEMNFEGVVISDWGAIWELINHGIAVNSKEAAKLAIEAGVDIDMVTACYCRRLVELVNEKVIDENLIDEAVFRILVLKNKLGLFENPFKDADESIEKEIILCGKHRAIAREIAADTFVLLKNENVLPLKKKGSKTAFIGPYVSEKHILGSWSIFGKAEEAVSIEEAVKAKGAQGAVFLQGSPLLDNLNCLEEYKEELHYDERLQKKEMYMREAVSAAKEVDTVVLALGESCWQSGEAASRADITLPDCQMDLFRQIYAVNRNIVVVLFSGRPLVIGEICQKAKAILEVWMPGTEGGNAIVDVLFGDKNPSGKLSMCFPYSAGQIPMSYSEFNTGRPYAEGSKGRYSSRYLDIPNKPLYPFGYGLSYTTFEISRVTLDHTVLTKDGKIEASVTVKNIGSITGKEVVQLYIQDVKGSVARPLRELKGFEKVRLEPGEVKKVTFEIHEEMLRFHDIHMHFVSEPGEFRLYIGNTSATDNAAEFTLEEKL